ncbi:MAG: PKD domain-containing protein [Bacteroidales bacterium]|nr:PKD domain-containing protein [Bacteroidales bacterium]
MKTRYTLYILLIFLFCCSGIYGQSTSLPYTLNSTFTGWTEAGNPSATNRVWKSGHIDTPTGHNSLPTSGSYYYVVDNDVNTNGVPSSQGYVYTLMQQFDFSAIASPIITFDLYYYYDEDIHAEPPTFRLLWSTDPDNREPFYSTLNDGTAPDSWQTVNLCRPEFAKRSVVQLYMEIESHSGAGLVLAINNFKIGGLSASATTSPASCFGYTDGKIDISTSVSGLYDISLNAQFVEQMNGSSYTIANVENGIYTVEVSDVASGCLITKESVLVESPPEITFAPYAKSVICYGDNDGSIEFKSPNGGNTFSYSITGPDGPFETSPLFENLTGGTYSLVVKNENNCKSAVVEKDLGGQAILKFLGDNPVTHTDITSCYGKSEGSITVSATSSRGQVRYFFEPEDGSIQYTSNFSPTKNDLPAAKYKVIIKDVQDCEVDYPQLVEIKQPDQVVYKGATITDVTGCYGNTNGIITFNTPEGGTGDYLYSINDGITYEDSPIFSDLGAGTYTLTVTDSHHCYSIGGSQDVTIDQPTKLQMNVTSAGVQTCAGATDGSIVITASGNGGTYQYSILEDGSDWGSTNSFNVGAGNYYPKVKVSDDCMVAWEKVTITQPERLVIAMTQAYSEYNKCYNDKKGRIFVQAEGGTAPFTFTYDNFGAKSITLQTRLCEFESLGQGTYTLQIKDSKGCFSGTDQVVITHPDELKMNIVSADDATCYDKDDAKVVLSATGGTGDYRYEYRQNGNSSFYMNSTNTIFLYAGNYDFRVTDQNGCATPVQQASVSQPTKLTFTTQDYDIQSCHGDNDGKIVVTAQGGTPDYQYYLNSDPDHNPDESVFTNLAYGYYYVTVMDANGCQSKSQEPIFISQPEALYITEVYSKDIIGCKGANNGKITFMAGGGYGDIKARISESASYQDMVSFYSEFLNLPAGKYRPMIIDERNCKLSYEHEIEITEPELFKVENIETSPALCYTTASGSAKVTVSGGQQFQTQYPYHFYLEGSLDPNTYTGEFDGLYAGVYNYYVIDAYDCKIEGSFEITRPPELVVVSKDSTHVTTCYGDYTGTAEIVVEGGVAPYTYSASGNNYHEENTTGKFTKMPSSTYEFIITDKHGCQAWASVTIDQPEKFNYNAKITNSILCHGDNNAEITVSAQGGTPPYEFSFDNGKTYPYSDLVYSQVAPGKYYIKARDSKGCTRDHVYDLDIIDPPELSADYEKYDVVCNTGNTGKILSSAMGGTKPYQFSIDEEHWQYNSGVFSYLTDSTYSVTVKDANNCQVKLTDIKLTRPPNIAGFTLDKSEGCSPLQITMTQDHSGGFTTYDISDETKIYDCTGPTKYTFTNNTGHTQTHVIKASMMQADGVGCTDTASVKVTVFSKPITDVRVTNSSAVYPETTINFANMSQNITAAQWDFGDGNISHTIEESSHTYERCGNYNIVLIQTDGTCYDTLSIPFVIEGRPVIASMKTNTTQGCQPVTVEFSNISINSDSCIWNFGDGTTSKSPMPTHTFEGSGDYDVTLTAYGDCGAATTTTKTIHVFAQPSAAFAQNADTLYEGQELRLASESDGAAYYLWNFGDGQKSDEKNPLHVYQFGGTFDVSLIVTSPNSCTDTAIVKKAVTVIQSPIVKFPNAFTPDGDGLNDVFVPVHGDIAQYKIVILDRKGQIMYRSTNINEGWDGTRNGHHCPLGVYVYKADIVLRDKSFYQLTGYVVLLRNLAKK